MSFKTVSQSMREKQHQAMKIQEDGSLRTATVGARQLRQLKSQWSEYRSVTDPHNGPIDPVEALHRTGAILHAVADVITSERPAETNFASTDDLPGRHDDCDETT